VICLNIQLSVKKERILKLFNFYYQLNNIICIISKIHKYLREDYNIFICGVELNLMSALNFNISNYNNFNNNNSEMKEKEDINKSNFNQKYNQPFSSSFDFANYQFNEISPFTTKSLLDLSLASSNTLSLNQSEKDYMKNEEIQQVLSGERTNQLESNILKKSKKSGTGPISLSGNVETVKKNCSSDYEPPYKEPILQNTDQDFQDAATSINNIDNQLKYHMDMVCDF
jgi:hypothetical protein